MSKFWNIPRFFILLKYNISFATNIYPFQPHLGAYYPFCPVNPIKPVLNQLNPPQWVFSIKPGFFPSLALSERHSTVC